MRITLNISRRGNEDQDLLSLDIFPDMTIETLQSSISSDTGIPIRDQHLYHNGQRITDVTRTMQELGIADGELLALHVRYIAGHESFSAGAPGGSQRPAAQTSGASTSGSGAGGGGGGGGGNRLAQDPELLRLQILGNPELRAEVQRRSPSLAAVVDDPQRFAAQLQQGFDTESREREERERQIRALNDADPFDFEAQARIAEIIRQEQVAENVAHAMEHNPEVFGRVHMLYVDLEVNGHKVKALVDSGAQATIMSPSCAEACNIMRLVDKRFAGIARGVGTANIIGRVHSTQIKLGSLFLPCSFTVMEGKSVDILLGLDMLKRHQASLDLAKDKLIIQGVEIPFLGEADIPKDMEEAVVEEPTISGPGGTTIGARSGAVSAPGTSQASVPPTPAAAAAPIRAPEAVAPRMSSPPTVQATAPTSATQTSQPSVNEGSVRTLMDMGFSRQQAIDALARTDGNVEYAAGYLVGGM